MSNPKGLITPAEAKTLNDAYTKRCELISKDITKRPDNRSSWYALEDIENFIAYAKAQAKELGHEMNGIRIYCGAYPEVDGKAGYSTSFIIPTTSGDGKELDEDVDNPDLSGGNGLNDGGKGMPPSANYPQ
jgi:hypothetical protein